MHAMVVAVIAECLLCSAKIGSGTNRPRCGTLTDPWHDRGVIALARIVVRLLADLAGLVVLSLRPRRSIEAENLFLRRELALYQERAVRPRRVDAAMPCSWFGPRR